jgi:cytochrome c oxidase subunit 3
MKKVKENKDLKKRAFQQIEKMHHHKMFLFVSLFGSTLIFLFMLIAFATAPLEIRESPDFRIPKAFAISTIVLLLSSGTISRILPLFAIGELRAVLKWMGITLFLGLLFALCQFIGWQELSRGNVFFDGKNSGAYLYVISGLHLIHVVAGISYLIYLLLNCYNADKDGVKKLVYETNPYQKIKFEMLRDLWLFTSFIWLLLFLYFFMAY